MRQWLRIMCAVLLLSFSLRAQAQPMPTGTPDAIIDVLDLRDIDIKDAVRLIAQKSGLNIVTGDNVQGKVSVYLENIPAREALATVLQMNSLAFESSGDLLTVISDADYSARYGRPFSQRVVSRLYYLKGMKVEQAAQLLERLKNPFGKIIADSSSGTIYVEDTPQKLQEIERYLSDVDQPVQTQTITLQYLEAETAAQRLMPLLTPQLGSVQTDKQTNKIFLTDTAPRIQAVVSFLAELDLPRKAVVFDLSYAKADELLVLLRNYVTPGLGSLESNNRSNQLILVDTEARAREIDDMILQLDRKEQEVFIEAQIIQVVLKDEFKMGIDWEKIVDRAQGFEIKSSLGGTGTVKKGSLEIGTLSSQDYRAVIEALGTENSTHVLSKPRIAVMNNEEAKIMVGTTKPYITTMTTTPASGPVTVSEDVKFIDVGVKLAVTPTIHADGFITMKIRPEVSSAATSITTGQNNVIPIVDTSEVETTVHVKNGVTIMIGGLIKKENGHYVSKVPLLGDIPVLGMAFRSQGINKDNTEIIVFLTPRIITGDIH